MSAEEGDVRVAVIGDVVLQLPGQPVFFAPSAPVLTAADLTIAQIEVPYTYSKDVAAITVPSPATDPEGLRALAAAGVDVGTIAGNHAYDCGTEGVLETIRFCREAGMTPTGTGANLDEARTPAIVARRGLKIGVLSYNCVGPRESWATSKKAGSAYVKVLTHYDIDDANPGNPPQMYTFCAPESVEQMQHDIRRLAERVDVAIVVLHKGIGHTPVVVLQYEKELARAAIDAGASAVIGHHAHIMRGIEFYKGVPIFHGIGNFVTVTDVLTPGNRANGAELEAWARRRRELYGFSPDPKMPYYPFHPESRNTVIAIVDVIDGQIRAGFIPCWIDDEARPVPVGEDDDPGVVEYVRKITREGGWDTQFSWADDGVVVVSEH